MAVKEKKLRTAVSAVAQRGGLTWCKHGINEKFCVSCKQPPKKKADKE